MSTTPIASIHRSAADRTAINRANSQHSTGPRTEAGKRRSSLNALRHGLTAASAVLPSEDRAQVQAVWRGTGTFLTSAAFSRMDMVPVPQEIAKKL